ncbi:MAG TPA: hypothetical protein IAB23_03360 [Candidatus Scybalocola faecavium]|nr:hypothetical protein [Candidatus Scybalocola faecavium]
MKIVELKAERMKIYFMLCSDNLYGPLFDKEYFGIDMLFYNREQAEGLIRKNIPENIPMAKRLLKRFDDITRIIKESDEKTYIDVYGIRLNIATARKYMGESTDYYCIDTDEMIGFYEQDFTCHGFLGFEQKKLLDECDISNIEWYLRLKAAVAISDVMTEVDCDNGSFFSRWDNE